MKKKFCILLSVLLIIATAVFVGCDCKDKNKNQITERPRDAISLNVTQVEMVVGDQTALILSYQPIDGAVVVYQSSNEQVATVDDMGKVTALKPGSTTVSVSYGEETVSCDVTVGLGNYVPVATFNQLEGQNLRIAYGDKYNLQPLVKFNGKEYYDGQFTYVYDDSVIEISEDGVITAKAKGTTTVTASVEWLGVSGLNGMSKTFTVEVTNVVSFIVNDGADAEFNIYSIEDALLDCNDQMPFVAKAYFNGDNEITNLTVEVVEGAEYIEYADGLISSKGKYGDGAIKISCTHGGENFERTIKVNVLPVIYDYEPEIEYSAMDGKLPLNDIFKKEIKLNKVEYNGKTLAIDADSNTISEVINVDGKKTPSATELIVYDQAIGYKVKAKIYTKIIKEKEDLAIFKMQNFGDAYSGYYILANDIDAYGYVHQTPHVKCNTGASSGGLTGTFDGNGYVIKNLSFVGTDETTGLFGLFGEVHTGIIKNVAFKNAEIASGTGWQSLFSAQMNAVTMENVYVDLTVNSSSQFIGTLSFTMEGDCTLTNCLFDVKFNKDGIYRGSLYAGIERVPSTSAWSNVYVISSEALARKAKAGEEVRIADSENCVDLHEKVEKTISNITRYQDVDQMKQANNDYSAFTQTKYWKLIGGIPAWHDTIEYVESGYKLNYSQKEQNLDKDLSTLFPGFTDIESASIGYECSYSGGKIVITKNGEQNFVANGQTIKLAVVLGDVHKSFEVKLCSAFISNASDLAMFKVSAKTDSYAGYYLMTDNIDATGYVPVAHASITRNGSDLTGLAGTFDGNGYAISNLALASTSDDCSIFGHISRGTIKNLAIKNAVINGDQRYKMLFAVYAVGVTLENVYVELDIKTQGNFTGGIFYQMTEIYTNTFKNCIFNIKTDYSTATFYRGSLTGEASAPNTTKWENVYMISTLALANKFSESKVVDAKYVDGVQTGTVENIERYTTADKFSQGILAKANKQEVFDAFDNGYWTVDETNGSITFKNK